MPIANEIEQLRVLHEQGTLTDEEFAQAKAAVLTPYAPQSPAQHSSSDTLAVEQVLARLDREWMMERERYMITGRYGARSFPSEARSVFMGLVAGGFGLLWMSLAASMGAPGFFPLFGILFILVGVGSSISGFSKAQAYRQAEQAYQQQRAQLLAQQPVSDDDSLHSRYT